MATQSCSRCVCWWGHLREEVGNVVQRTENRSHDVLFLFLYKFIYFSWRLITLQYCIGFFFKKSHPCLEMAAYFSVYACTCFWLCWVSAAALTMHVYIYIWLCWVSAAALTMHVYIYIWLCWVSAAALTMHVYVYIWLCWVSAAALRLAQGATLHCSVWASHCRASLVVPRL